jgi:hypothetical protein
MGKSQMKPYLDDTRPAILRSQKSFSPALSKVIMGHRSIHETSFVFQSAFGGRRFSNHRWTQMNTDECRWDTASRHCGDFLSVFICVDPWFQLHCERGLRIRYCSPRVALMDREPSAFCDHRPLLLRHRYRTAYVSCGDRPPRNTAHPTRRAFLAG